MNQIFKQIINTGRESDMPVLGRVAKAQSELGELAEAILIEQGLLDKALPESSFGEAADTIICILDVLGAQYPQLSDDWILQNLETYLQRKHAKWQRIVDLRNMKERND